MFGKKKPTLEELQKKGMVMDSTPKQKDEPKVEFVIPNPPVQDDKLKRIEELQRMLDAEKAKLEVVEPEPVQEVKEEELPEVQLTIEERLKILEKNLNDIFNDIHDRLSALERAMVKKL